MRRSTGKSLIVTIIVLVLIIAVILVLTSRDKDRIPSDKLGDTVIGEQAAGSVRETEDTAETPAEQPQTEELQTEPETPAPEPVSVDLPNEKVVRLYTGGGGVMELVTDFTSVWTVDQDIATFEAFNAEDDVLYYNNYYTAHQTYWDAVETDTKYKIGYELSFDVNGEHKVYSILEPADISENPDLYMGDYAYDEYGNLLADGITGYMGVWVYCDMWHDSTYVHLSQEDMTEDTVMTSIKLRPTPQSDAVSNCRLKAFSYSSDEEFNAEGRYIGTHAYEITINNQE